MRRSAVAFVAGLLVGCGVVGSPIPPQDVGVGPTIEKQKKQEALVVPQREEVETKNGGEPQGQDLDLPPLRPVGTR